MEAKNEIFFDIIHAFLSNIDGIRSLIVECKMPRLMRLFSGCWYILERKETRRRTRLRSNLLRFGRVGYDKTADGREGIQGSRT